MNLGVVDEAEWERVWLPRRPLASDELVRGLYRMSRQEALRLRHVEANPQAMSNLLIVDIDHGDAALRALGTRPLPHLIVENPSNGHAHAVWVLAEPVTRTEYAHRKPLAFAAAVAEGLRRACDGDQGYSGLITHNPLHEAWRALSVASLGHLYGLGELADGLDRHMPPPRWRESKRQRDNPVGLGRNCTLFETARTWAYSRAKQIRVDSGHQSATPADVELLAQVLGEEAARINASFSEPLPTSEIRATARSIHRWTTTRFHGWTDTLQTQQAKYSRIQTTRGHQGGVASGETRRTKRDERLAAL